MTRNTVCCGEKFTLSLDTVRNDYDYENFEYTLALETIIFRSLFRQGYHYFPEIVVNLAILCDRFWIGKWPFQRLSDLQLGDNKVTLNHLDLRLLIILIASFFAMKLAWAFFAWARNCSMHEVFCFCHAISHWLDWLTFSWLASGNVDGGVCYPWWLALFVGFDHVRSSLLWVLLWQPAPKSTYSGAGHSCAKLMERPLVFWGNGVGTWKDRSNSEVPLLKQKGEGTNGLNTTLYGWHTWNWSDNCQWCDVSKKMCDEDCTREGERVALFPPFCMNLAGQRYIIFLGSCLLCFASCTLKEYLPRKDLQHVPFGDTVDGSEILHQLRLIVYPIVYKVLYIPGGAGFLPSTVAW